MHDTLACAQHSTVHNTMLPIHTHLFLFGCEVYRFAIIQHLESIRQWFIIRRKHDLLWGGGGGNVYVHSVHSIVCNVHRYGAR